MIPRLASVLAKCLQYILVMQLFLLLGLTLWQVFARYVLGNPDTSTDELLRILLMWFGMLAGAYCVWARTHVGFDLVARRLNDSSALLIRWLVLALSLGVVISLLVVGGMRLVLLAAELDQRTPVMGLAMAQIYWILPISGILMVIFLLAPSTQEDSAGDADLEATHEEEQQ